MSRAPVAVLLLLVLGCGKHDRAPAKEGSPAKASIAPQGRSAAFWNWFSQHAAELRADTDLRRTMERVSAELEKAQSGVFAEIGKDGDDRELVISADGKKELFPAVQQIYAARPTVAGWKIVAFRQRAKPGDPLGTIEMGSQKIDPTKVKFVATPAGSQIDLEVFIPGFTTIDEMGQLGFVLLDHIVGEYDMETKIAGIDFAALDKAPRGARPLTELPSVIDAL